ncbi:MAG TPA: flagellar filament capping protein FliD [Microthrixaceae bacterium]|nr:flagellar filament capping protein FliD [Microthrixaceae bacterium]
MVTIDGLVTGLDTSSIIQQLMQLERLPQDALVARRQAVQARLDAYASVRSKLSAVSTAAAKVADPASWTSRTATSSSPEVASVTSAAGAATGALRFTVDQLAAAHAVRGVNTAASLDTVVAGGPLTFDLGDGDPVVVDVGGGTLSEVVDAVNRAGIRVRAAAVNTGDGYHLQLTSTETGVASAFSVTGLDAALGGTVETTVGRDAQLTIGEGAGAYTVTSSSNSFADLLPGVTVTAVSVSDTPVEVTVADDVDALAEQVKAMVEAVNAALSEISTRTAYDAGSGRASSLAGDSTVRRAAQELTRALIDAVGPNVPGNAGVKLDRNGRFTFDEAAFKAAYTKDPDAVRDTFVRGASTTGPLRFNTAGPRAVEGTYEVVITREAEAGQATGPAWPVGAPTTIVVRVGSTEVDVALTGSESAEDAAAALQAAIDAAGLRLTAGTEGGALTLRTNDLGSGAKFEVAWDGTTFTEHQGVDVAGTINGVEANGVGNFLTVPATEPGLGGLSVIVEGGGTGAIGSITYTPGAAQRVTSVLRSALDLVDGYLTSTEKASEQRITDLRKSIDAFEVRLAAREARLRLYYSNLEVALGNLQQQSSWLSGQIAGMFTG